MIRPSLYRPFFKQNVAFDRTLNSSTSRLPSLFPMPESPNLVLHTVNPGSRCPFGAAVTDCLADLGLFGRGAERPYARWRYEDVPDEPMLLDTAPTGRVSNINRRALAQFRDTLGDDISDDDLFFYVYGVLHAPDFRGTFEASLAKEAPRVPLVESRVLFDTFAAAGRELCDLHANYETAELYPLTEEWAAGADPDTNPELLLVGSTRMSYPKSTVPGRGHGTRGLDRSRLRYNDDLTLSGIPAEAHEYVIGLRSGIDWIIDRYYVKTDKASGIVNDPNQWGLERGNPRYILDLVKRVVTVSVRTVDIVAGLPSLEETIARLGPVSPAASLTSSGAS